MVANLGGIITFDDVAARVLLVYLMHDCLPWEVYGDEMRLCLISCLSPELKFGSVDELIAGIAVAKRCSRTPRRRSTLGL